MSEEKFTQRQQRFIDFFDGNGTEAARRAGYSGSDKALSREANRLLGNARVALEIRKRQDKEVRTMIANRQERQMFWTAVMQDVAEDMKHRLKASEYLGRSEADFIEKVEHSGKMTLEDLVVNSLGSA